VYDRLDQVFQLKPSKRYWGKNAYEGYTALEFHGRAKILLTSPIYGNAIYILDKREWRYLTNTYRKEEIRFKFPEKSTTFPHEGAWLHKVHRELQRASFG